MVNTDLIRLFLKEIEQSIRSDEQTIHHFIDFKEILVRARNERNQMFFGRRGTGKTLLINNYLKHYPYAYHAKVGIEAYKSLSLADALINTLKTILFQFQKQIDDRKTRTYLGVTFFRPSIIGTIKSEVDYLQQLIDTPETFSETNTSSEELSQTDKVSSKVLEFQDQEKSSRSMVRAFQDKKTRLLYNRLPRLRELFAAICDHSSLGKVYISLDDFYFIPKKDQPYFLDFYHNLTKSNTTILKISTIKHRTNLSVQADTFIGVELGDDIQGIDLDYCLDSFSELESFLSELLDATLKRSFAESLRIEDILNEESIKLLYVASGGVPRDFLNYILSVCEEQIKTSNRLESSQVLEVISRSYTDKKQALARDTGTDTDELMECLDYITKNILDEKMTNIFLITTNLNELDKELDRCIKELVDLRFLHVLSSSVDLKENHRYTALLVDMCLYANRVMDHDFNYKDITIIRNGVNGLKRMPKLKPGFGI